MPKLPIADEPAMESSSVRPSQAQLDSWKEIAIYVKRDVSTVQRWERREGMPVHRHVHEKRGSVYAFPSELDAWLESRRPRAQEARRDRDAESPPDADDHGAGRRRAVRGLLVPGGASVLALMAVTYVVTRGPAEDAARTKIESLAVLPLKDLSGRPSQEFLADGITEAVIARLSRIRGLRVISRTSVMSFKDTRLSVPEIAHRLRVDALVEGSVLRENGRVRVHAQLILGATDTHVWSETYDAQSSDVLALESQVANAIARKLEVTLTEKERTRLVAARQVSPEVYESYLKGRFGGTNNQAEVEESIRHFEEAIAKDPTFAPAYVGLAAAYKQLSTVFLGARPDDVRPKMTSAARKALELDPELAEAHVLLGAAYEPQFRWAEAEAEYKRALELNPNDAEAHLALGKWLVRNGRTEEGIAWCRRARELDPLGIGGKIIGFELFLARRYEEARRELRSALALRPDDANALWYLGFVLAADHEPDGAVSVLERALSVSGRSPGVIGVLVRAYTQSGRQPEALQLLAELKRRHESAYVPAGAFVNAYLGLGDRDQVFIWLERAYREQSNIVRHIKVHPYFDPLRDDPRFVDLLRRTGLD